MLKRLFILLMSLAWTIAIEAQHQPSDTICLGDTLISEMADSLPTKASIHPWRTTGEIVLANGVTYLLGRYVFKMPFSQTTLKTTRNNFKSGFAWDDDNFYVNMAGHAYHGSVYFNAARSNGMNFWQSVPYTTVGSVIWEYLGENEQPSINDVICTTFSGSFMGEITHNMYHQLIDDSERGMKRFFREATAAILNPVGEFHRVISGQAWKVKRNVIDDTTGTSPTDKQEAIYSLTLGDRCLISSEESSSRRHQPFLTFTMEYGDVADGEKHCSPYDFFIFDSSIAIGKGQHLLSHLFMLGRLCSTPAFTKENARGEFGLYQFFDYDDTRLPGNSTHTPFPFGEIVSFGPGVMFSFPKIAPRIAIEQRFFTKGIVLGAIKSDYYKYYNRTYNMGSGFGALSQSKMTWKNVGNLQLKAQYMHLFTWKGYEPRDLSEIHFNKSNYLNVLGDRSNARLLCLSLQTAAFVSQEVGITLGASYYSRHTHYKYFPNHQASSYEMRAGVEWHF